VTSNGVAKARQQVEITNINVTTKATRNMIPILRGFPLLHTSNSYVSEIMSSVQPLNRYVAAGYPASDIGKTLKPINPIFASVSRGGILRPASSQHPFYLLSDLCSAIPILLIRNIFRGFMSDRADRS
jgi:hypothetical protein